MVCTHCLCDSSRLERKVLGELWKRVDFILLSLYLLIIFKNWYIQGIDHFNNCVYSVISGNLFIFQTRSHITQAGLEFPPGDLPSLPQMLR